MRKKFSWRRSSAGEGAPLAKGLRWRRGFAGEKVQLAKNFPTGSGWIVGAHLPTDNHEKFHAEKIFLAKEFRWRRGSAGEGVPQGAAEYLVI